MIFQYYQFHSIVVLPSELQFNKTYEMSCNTFTPSKYLYAK